MTLAQLIENCHLDQHCLDLGRVAQEIEHRYRDPEIMAFADRFVGNLGSGSPGSTWLTFLGIQDWWREHQFITPRQRRWLIIHMIQEWPHVHEQQRSIWMI